jgi:hypothetical protein
MFLKRQDAALDAQRKESQRVVAEANYATVLDKKRCPVCGNFQSHEEVVKKQKSCKGDFCGGAPYQRPNSFNAPAFMARMAMYDAKHREAMEKSEKETAEGQRRTSSFAARRLPRRAASGGGGDDGEGEGGGYHDHGLPNGSGRSGGNQPHVSRQASEADPTRDLRPARYWSREAQAKAARGAPENARASAKASATAHGAAPCRPGATAGALGRPPPAPAWTLARSSGREAEVLATALALRGGEGGGAGPDLVDLGAAARRYAHASAQAEARKRSEAAFVAARAVAVKKPAVAFSAAPGQRPLSSRSGRSQLRDEAVPPVPPRATSTKLRQKPKSSRAEVSNDDAWLCLLK